MRYNHIVAIVGALVLNSCNQGETKSSDSNAENTSKIETPIEKSTNDQSQETLTIANAFMNAMGQGDMDTMIGLMHDDMVWQNAGDSSLPWIGPWRGKKAILEDFFPVFGENFKTLKLEPSDSFAQGDTAAYFGHMVGLLSKSNQETNEFTYALRVKVKDGKVVLWNWFEDSFEVSRAYHNK
ncbi:MAG: nuclear transport factor 2 family protein [Bacteroidota bacterium]